MKLPNEHAEIITCRNREEWLAERKKSTGASDAAPAIGYGNENFGSPYGVWADKTEPPMLSESTERLQLGLDLEPVVCKAYQRKYGGQVEGWPAYTIVRDKRRPFLHCTPDAILYDKDHEGPGVAQIKTWSPFDKKAWDNGPPLHIQIQVQDEMAITGCQWAYVPVLFGCDQIERFEVPRNDEFIDALMEALEKFWGYVVDRVEPPLDASVATADALARLHPNDNGALVALPDEADAVLDSLARAMRMESKAKRRKASCKNQLKAWMGDNSYGVTASGRTASWKSQTRRSYVVEETTYRVLRPDVKLPKGVQYPDEIDYKVAGRTKLPRGLKARMLDNNPHCRWCGATLTMHTATFEHLVPLSLGGTNDDKNLAIACEDCNQSRGNDATLSLESK